MVELTTLADLEGAPHAAVFGDGEPRTIRLQLDADERVPPHTHPGTTVVIHVVSGHLALDLDDETHDVRAGELVRFAGDREISPLARVPTTAVVVLSPTA